MAASWDSFISNVSSKLESQTIGSYDEMADFLRKEYIKATVGKAASPYGQKHRKGKDNIIFNGFKKGFKILYEGGDLTFEEKKTNPEYADLDVQPPTIDVSDSADQVDLDFRDWVEENKSTIPPFTYSQFFSQFPNFPPTKKEAVTEIAKKILHEFDGKGLYIQWMYSLRTGSYSDWGNAIMNEIVKIIKKEADKPLQLGDLVRGYAMYLPLVNLKKIKINYFDKIGGDINLDDLNIRAGSREYNRILSERVLKGGDEEARETLYGKIVSIGQKGGKQTVKISTFDKRLNRNFIRELIPSSINRKIFISDLTSNIPGISISDRIFQEQHRSNPGKIPKYLTQGFITNFTYSRSAEKTYFRTVASDIAGFSSEDVKEFENKFNDRFDGDFVYSDEIEDYFSGRSGRKNSFANQIDGILQQIQGSNYNNGYGSFYGREYQLAVAKSRKINSKNLSYASEEERYRKLRIRWIEEIAEKAKKVEDPDKPENPYNVMAKGIIDYWKSLGPQPLANMPAAPPCIFSPPQGGTYIPIYYGSQTMLGNNLKRAFNSGKRFTKPPEKKIASLTVASALAYSFSMHLLELKFIYMGGIPGPNGPIPMIGFVPLVY
jgi:hypothetical protein